MAHGFLSYQDTRGEVDYLGKIYRAIKDYLDKREKREKQKEAVDEAVSEVVVNELREGQPTLPGAETPLLKQGNTAQLPEGKPPLQRMLGGSALQRAALPGAVVTPTQAMGGPLANVGFSGKPLKSEGFVGDRIIDISATTVGVEKDLGGGDMFTKRLNTIDDGLGSGPGGSGEVVQAIDRLTFVTMSLVAATREQTKQQALIAQQQQQQAQYLAREAKEAAEESALEMGGPSSGNSPYQRLLEAGVSTMGGGGRGGPGMGIGGKVIAKNILKAATKRGAVRTGSRLGAAVGGKLLGGVGARAGAKLGAKSAGKIAGSTIAKSIGKKIPLLGLGLGAVFAAQRAMQGDFVGAGLELASGAASTVPGIGTVGSVGIDAALAARDMGVTPFASGGIVSDATMGLVGEAGKEGVFPLEGSEGKKTFLKFGEGIIDAQKKRKSDSSRILAAGLSEYYDKQNGWDKFLDMLAGLFKGFNNFKFKWPWEKDDKGNGGGGGGVGGGVNAANIEADTAEEKAFIATVRETEGTAGAQGYNTVYGGAVVPELTQMTLKELHDAIKLGGTDKLPSRLGGGIIPFKKDQYNSSASGALQLMPDTLLSMINRGEFKWDDVFSPETQNRMILTLARNGGVDIENMSPAMIDKASGIWAGLSGAVHGQTSRTGEYTYNNIYKQNLKEAQTQAPTPDPADDRRKIDASQRISQNFGRNAGQSIAFTHNGKDYHAVKTTNGWDLYFGKGGIHGNKGRVDTSNGRNAGIMESFLDQAEAGGGYTRPDDGEFEKSLERAKTSSASSDGATKLAMRSAEENLVASASSGTTVINNNTYVTGSSGSSGGAPADVPIGTNMNGMGSSWYAPAQIAAIG